METSTAESLERVIATLNDLIALTRRHGLSESAQFLAMAKMQLQIDLNGVTDEEFRALCDALEGKHRKRDAARARPGHSRNRREAEMKLMRRAWQCQHGVAAPRGGRNRVRQ